MDRSVSYQLLQDLLDRNDPQEAFDVARSRGLEEGQFLEYKRSAVLREGSPSDLVREYAAGFANAEGGVLLVGIGDGGSLDKSVPRVMGKSGRTKLLDWVENCLASLHSLLIPAPVLAVVTESGIEILLVAVARAPTLIACPVKGTPVFYLRMGSTNLELNHFLVSDLILGRRAHPVVEVQPVDRSSERVQSALLKLRVVNASDHWVPSESAYGGVGPGLVEVTGRMRAYVSPVGDVKPEHMGPESLRGLAPFGETTISLNWRDPVPFHEPPNSPIRYRWLAGIYLAFSGHPVVWYQVEAILVYKRSLPITGTRELESVECRRLAPGVSPRIEFVQLDAE